MITEMMSDNAEAGSLYRIVGIGTDLIESARVEKACRKDTFVEKCFTEKEKELIRRHKGAAANNFAVKEAVAKSFGCGFSGISLLEIEVLRDEKGAPYVVLYNRAKKMADNLGIREIHVSISDTKELSSAFVVCSS